MTITPETRCEIALALAEQAYRFVQHAKDANARAPSRAYWAQRAEQAAAALEEFKAAFPRQA